MAAAAIPVRIWIRVTVTVDREVCSTAVTAETAKMTNGGKRYFTAVKHYLERRIYFFIRLSR